MANWANSRARPDTVAKRKICPTRNQTWIPVGSRLYSRCYWACYPSISSLAGCQNSIVSLLITWWATWNGFQLPIFLFPNCSDQLWKQPSLPFNWHQKLFFLWVTWLECEAQYSAPPHALMPWTGTALLLVLPSPLPFYTKYFFLSCLPVHSENKLWGCIKTCLVWQILEDSNFILCWMRAHTHTHTEILLNLMILNYVTRLYLV